MRRIDPTGQFRRDVRRELRGRYRQIVTTELDDLIGLLTTNSAIPAHHRDHALTGEWKGYRDCHVKPDLVLIYRKVGDDILQLIRLGSHSEFGW